MATNSTQYLAASTYGRILVYGDPKTQKTWWALKAAEAGYNVTWIDGDDSRWKPPLTNDAWSRINLIDAVDTTGIPVFKNLMDAFARGNQKFIWDLQNKRVVDRTNPDGEFMLIDQTKWTGRDVIIIDSWKALCWSVKYCYAIAQKINLADAEKEEWPGYRWEADFLKSVLNWMHKVPAHIIIVNHQFEHSKMAVDKATDKVKTLWTKIIPVSSSANASYDMLGHLTDILWFHRVSSEMVYISTKAEADRIGGSRNIEPGDYMFSQLPPARALAKLTMGPEGESQGAVFVPKGSQEIVAPAIKAGGSAMGSMLNVGAKPVMMSIKKP